MGARKNFRRGGGQAQKSPLPTHGEKGHHHEKSSKKAPNISNNFSFQRGGGRPPTPAPSLAGVHE